MPNKDGTGPTGKGCKTGMQRGNCEGAEPLSLQCQRGRRSFRRRFNKE